MDYSTTQPYSALVKLVLAGDSAVGKSALHKRLAEDTFAVDYQHTVGVDFRLTGVTLGDKRIKLQIWDTAGQERYRTITSSYYRGAHGILLLFDLTDRSTFESLPSWFNEIEINVSSKNVPIMLLGAKADRVESQRSKRQVPRDEAESFAEERGVAYLEFSSKTQTSSALNDAIMKPFVTRVLGSPHYSLLNQPCLNSIEIRAESPTPSLPSRSLMDKRPDQPTQRGAKKKSSWCC
jgi:small GTP-binding protein